MNISVLMSLYIKEKPEYLRESLDSVLSQTLLPDEIVMVIDGPITKQLQEVLDEYQQKTPLLRLLPQEENRGLGVSLAIGVEACRSELIARMDTDDIMVPTRLAVQREAFSNDSSLVICSSNISEFDGNVENVVGRRVVPESNEDIRKFSRRRSPFNHMTVMYKRDAVIRAGNYKPLQGFEDYYLWVRMLRLGMKALNIQQDLVFARAGKDLFSRRGGFKYLVSGIKGRYKIYKEGLGTFSDFLFVSTVHIIFSVMPNALRERLYTKKLHTK